MVRYATRGHLAEKSWSTGATKATTEKKLASVNPIYSESISQSY